jgi:nardilysin
MEQKVKKAAAAMVVGVGSFADPEDMQGMSHYLEHMLFMGSKDFPGENEFGDFLGVHAGCTNAYTECELTNYHFDVEASCLRGALKRFSGFFKAPLCSESALEREVWHQSDAHLR